MFLKYLICLVSGLLTFLNRSKFDRNTRNSFINIKWFPCPNLILNHCPTVAITTSTVYTRIIRSSVQFCMLYSYSSNDPVSWHILVRTDPNPKISTTVPWYYCTIDNISVLGANGDKICSKSRVLYTIQLFIVYKTSKQSNNESNKLYTYSTAASLVYYASIRLKHLD